MEIVGLIIVNWTRISTFLMTVAGVRFPFLNFSEKLEHIKSLFVFRIRWH